LSESNADSASAQSEAGSTRSFNNTLGDFPDDFGLAAIVKRRHCHVVALDEDLNGVRAEGLSRTEKCRI
jgi:hypothetical protein